MQIKNNIRNKMWEAKIQENLKNKQKIFDKGW